MGVLATLLVLNLWRTGPASRPLTQKAIDAANDLSRAPLKAPELPEPTRRR